MTAIDVETLQTREFIIPDLVSGPFGIAATPDRIFVSDMGTNEIIALSLEGDIITRVQAPDSPRSLAVSADGRSLYATSFTTPQLAMFDTQTLQRTDLLDLPLAGSFAIAASPDGAKLYVTGHVDNAIVVVDALEPAVITSIAIGDNPRAVSFSPDGARVMVTSAQSNQIHFIDATSDAIVGSYQLSGQPRGIAVVDAPRFVDDVPTAVAEPPLPNGFSLAQPFPNPFNSAIQIRFTIPDGVAGSGEPTSILVYDVLGQRIRTLASDNFQPGAHTVVWDGRDDEANTVAAGAYVVLLRAAHVRAVSKIMFLK